jgi:hypothetical protein
LRGLAAGASPQPPLEPVAFSAGLVPGIEALIRSIADDGGVWC